MFASADDVAEQQHQRQNRERQTRHDRQGIFHGTPLRVRFLTDATGIRSLGLFVPFIDGTAAVYTLLKINV